MERCADAYRPRARILALVEQVGTTTPELTAEVLGAMVDHTSYVWARPRP
jgi:hypothetical protein